ncbi:MAG TPA: vanadium-dependent haloperoxidase [Steroidobacteraceae bacterium]|nr:vanadium-dependent haloperoxidase [Steroidobacteraceae bacterium]
MNAPRLSPLIGVTLGLAFGSASASNAVSDWHTNMESAVVVAGKKSPTVAFVYFAYADVAMYDAVNSIDGRFEPFAVHVQAPPDASEDAAASVAAHDVLVHYLPLQQATLDAQLQASLSAIPNGPPKTDGVNVGQAVAAQWLAIRSGDGLEAAVSLPLPNPGPGVWQPVPTYPSPNPITPPPVAEWQAQFKPFVLRSADQYLEHVPAPPALTSATFTADFNLTKSYGALDSSVRTAQQTEIGLFWSDNPAAQYSRALRGLIGTQGLGTADAARLGALSFVALADSATACMNAKYHFLFWRPLTAIRNAGTDGNPGTVADPNWVPLDVTPGHPEYPANHGCVTQALMDAMTAFFATDAVPYSITSTVTGTTHSFASFEDVVQEVDEARIFGGMHFHHSVKEGNKLGRRVADYILDHKFCRVNEGCGTEDQ